MYWLNTKGIQNVKAVLLFVIVLFISTNLIATFNVENVANFIISLQYNNQNGGYTPEDPEYGAIIDRPNSDQVNTDSTMEYALIGIAAALYEYPSNNDYLEALESGIRWLASVQEMDHNTGDYDWHGSWYISYFPDGSFHTEIEYVNLSVLSRRFTDSRDAYNKRGVDTTCALFVYLLYLHYIITENPTLVNEYYENAQAALDFIIRESKHDNDFFFSSFTQDEENGPWERYEVQYSADQADIILGMRAGAYLFPNGSNAYGYNYEDNAEFLETNLCLNENGTPGNGNGFFLQNYIDIDENYSITYSEGFENSGNLPVGWTVETIPVGEDGWQFIQTSPNTYPSSAFEGNYFACLYSDDEATSTLTSTELSLADDRILAFQHFQSYNNSNCEFNIYYKTSAQGDLILLDSFSEEVGEWKFRTYLLPEEASYIVFEATTYDQCAISIDDIQIISTFDLYNLFATGWTNEAHNLSLNSGFGCIFQQGYLPWVLGNNTNNQLSFSLMSDFESTNNLGSYDFSDLMNNFEEPNLYDPIYSLSSILFTLASSEMPGTTYTQPLVWIANNTFDDPSDPIYDGDGGIFDSEEYANPQGYWTKYVNIAGFALMALTQFDNMLDFVPPVSNVTTGTVNWDNPMFIANDVTVSSGATLNINSNNIRFLGGYDFIIDGTVNITGGAILNLCLGTNVQVNSTGTLFLDWGSTLTGATPTLYPPPLGGYPAGAETPIPGDRIVAIDGGIITTRTETQYNTNPGNEIEINSSTDYLWDGIFIKNPDDDEDYWFVNCDISGIRKIAIENTETRTSANLKLYQTDFHDAGQIIVRDGHLLYIHGEEGEENLCHFYNNNTTPITAYNSKVDISYCSISQNDCGLYIYESAGDGSTISYCDFFDNSGEGVKLDGAYLEFYHNNIYNNDRFGLLAYPTTTFNGEFTIYEFDYVDIENNGYAEYAGWYETFNMGSDITGIDIYDSDFSTGTDTYLMMYLGFNETNDPPDPRADIQGVEVNGTSIVDWISQYEYVHLFPNNENAWDIGHEISDERLMLYSAANDMGLGNYSTAELTLQSLISTYPLSQEAGTAVYYLYHLEGLTDCDYPALITYLESLEPESESPLENAVDVIITKSYMKDNDYLTAIDRLEYVIEYSQDPDEVIMAMIDEGYCYLELSDEGERSLPAICTIKTSTIDSYQSTVKALESQLSFFPKEGKNEDENITPSANDVLTLSNYPNPFNPTTMISFSLPEDSKVELSIYNIKGQKVKTVLNEFLEKGVHSIEWNGTDSNNKTVASGVYFYQISADKKFKMKKMLLLK